MRWNPYKHLPQLIMSAVCFTIVTLSLYSGYRIAVNGNIDLLTKSFSVLICVLSGAVVLEAYLWNSYRISFLGLANRRSFYEVNVVCLIAMPKGTYNERVKQQIDQAINESLKKAGVPILRSPPDPKEG